MITDPDILLADEPTGALDSETSTQVMALLMVTHSVRAASHAGRVLFIKDGEIFHQIYKGNMTNDEMYMKISNTLTILLSGGDLNE